MPKIEFAKVYKLGYRNKGSSQQSVNDSPKIPSNRNVRLAENTGFAENHDL